MEYLQIKNWERFQHYKNRNPPWIKLYCNGEHSLLDKYEFANLPDASKAHLVGIWMLASRHGGRIPFDKLWIKSQINSTENIDFDILIDGKWFEIKRERRYQRASKTQATSPQNATPEKEIEKDSVANATDADASLGLKSRIFGPAREWLGKQAQLPDRKVRALLGKWCRDHGDGRTLEALQAAGRNAPLDPIPYITRLLTEKPRGRKPSRTEADDRADILRGLGLAGGLETPPAGTAQQSSPGGHASGAGEDPVPGGSPGNGDSSGQVIPLRPDVRDLDRDDGGGDGFLQGRAQEIPHRFDHCGGGPGLRVVAVGQQTSVASGFDERGFGGLQAPEIKAGGCESGDW